MRFLLIFSFPLLIILSCNSFPSIINPLSKQSGEIQFQDDFSNPNSGWIRLSDDLIGSLDYFAESYKIIVKHSYTMLWSGPGLEFTDVQIEVDTMKLDRFDNDIFGIVCRSMDNNNYYYLVISSDGYYGIGKVKSGVQELIEMPEMLPSENIFQGQNTNHLRADCVGTTLALYANGVQVISVQDNEFPSGDVGLIAGTFADPSTTIIFDNFSVLMP
jgi:hypothetical protein